MSGDEGGVESGSIAGDLVASSADGPLTQSAAVLQALLNNTGSASKRNIEHCQKQAVSLKEWEASLKETTTTAAPKSGHSPKHTYFNQGRLEILPIVCTLGTTWGFYR